MPALGLGGVRRLPDGRDVVLERGPASLVVGRVAAIVCSLGVPVGDEEAPASETPVQAEAPEEPVAEAETNHEPEVVTDYEIVIDPEYAHESAQADDVDPQPVVMPEFEDDAEDAFF